MLTSYWGLSFNLLARLHMLVTGEGGATIRLIALDGTNVRIETDTDGDGVVDASEDTTWDDIASPVASLP